MWSAQLFFNKELCFFYTLSPIIDTLTKIQDNDYNILTFS